MTASPLIIRRQADYATPAPLHATVNGRHANIGAPYGSTPSGKHFYGSTPGGTRIVYSREQLLMLASSPLTSSSQQAMFSHLPDEISRSPDKKTFEAGPDDIHRALNGQLYTAPAPRTSPPGLTKQKSNSPPAPLNLSSSGPRNIGLARSPQHSAVGNGALGGSKPRSPGNAFNFAGPISPAATQITSISSSFKDRMEAAAAAATTKQQPKQRRSSGGSGRSARSDGDDTFTMEM